jgi:hypothetical protein
MKSRRIMGKGDLMYPPADNASSLDGFLKGEVVACERLK